MLNAATYRFGYIRLLEGQNFEFWGSPGGTAPQKGDFVPGTAMYHHAEFHADRCHRRRDICNRTEKYFCPKTFLTPPPCLERSNLKIGLSVPKVEKPCTGRSSTSIVKSSR